MKAGKNILRYKYLVLDHDDTTVRSTPEIHYPQWLETLALMRPGYEVSLEEFMRMNSEMGFYTMIEDVMHFTPEEISRQYKMWRAYTETHLASFFPGMPEIIADYKAAGGVIAVCTHNAAANVLREYEAQYGGKVKPDVIFDCEIGKERLKPHPYALYEFMRLYECRPDEVIMVDDMMPGLEMAEKGGVHFAAAGWSHTVESVKKAMLEKSEYYLENTAQLRKLLFYGEEPEEKV